MKKLITIFLILFFASVAFGQDIIVAKKKGAPDYYCDSCPDATGGADVDCEVPDGTVDGLCGWTVVETGGATGEINMADACDNSPALGCTDIPMTYCMSVVKTNTTETDLYAKIAVSGVRLYIQFYIKILAESLENTESFRVFGLTTDGVTGSVDITLFQTGGLLYFQRGYHIAAGWQQDVGGTAVTLDTWYGIRLDVNDGSDTVQWWVDYNSDGIYTDEGTASGLTLDRTPIVYIQLGDSGITYTHSFMITGLKVDDDTMPNECVR